jgi:hypothetical protein
MRFRTGMMMTFAGSKPPRGWLFCDGRDVPAGEKYDTLREMIGLELPLLEPMAVSETGGLGRRRAVSKNLGDAVRQIVYKERRAAVPQWIIKI